MRASCSAQLVTEPCNRVKRPRNVHSKRHGPVEHLRLLKTGSERLSFVNCRTFGSDDASVQSKLSSYVMQLSRLGVGACGVAEIKQDYCKSQGFDIQHAATCLKVHWPPFASCKTTSSCSCIHLSLAKHQAQQQTRYSSNLLWHSVQLAYTRLVAKHAT